MNPNDFRQLLAAKDQEIKGYVAANLALRKQVEILQYQLDFAIKEDASTASTANATEGGRNLANEYFIDELNSDAKPDFIQNAPERFLKTKLSDLAPDIIIYLSKKLDTKSYFKLRSTTTQFHEILPKRKRIEFSEFKQICKSFHPEEWMTGSYCLHTDSELEDDDDFNDQKKWRLIEKQLNLVDKMNHFKFLVGHQCASNISDLLSNPELLETIKTNEFIKDCLLWAAASDEYEIAQKLIDLGVEIYDYTEDISSPFLNTAANAGDLKKVRILVEANHCLDIVDEEGEDVLMGAVNCGQFEIVKYLVEDVGMDVNHMRYGRTALVVAIECGSTDTVDYLILKGADFKSTFGEISYSYDNEDDSTDGLENEDYTYLHIAIENAHLDIVTLLVEKGCNVDIYFEDCDEGCERVSAIEYCFREAENNESDVFYAIALFLVNNTCRLCRGRGSLRCSKCMATSYCSKSCQKEDWKLHKLACPNLSAGIFKWGSSLNCS
jgi:hypothetical protein